MDLEQFVFETLGQIVTGVEKAQDKYAKLQGSQINPDLHLGRNRGMAPAISTDQYGAEIERVEFDVALTISESKETGGGGGIKVLSLGADLKHAQIKETNTVSRVRFSVPVAFKVKRPK